MEVIGLLLVIWAAYAIGRWTRRPPRTPGNAKARVPPNMPRVGPKRDAPPPRLDRRAPRPPQGPSGTWTPPNFGRGDLPHD